MQDVCFIGAVTVSLLGLEDALDLVEFETNDDAVPAIGVLSRLDDPRIELVNRIRVVLVVLGDGVVVLQKLQVLIVLESSLDVEGER